MAGKMSEHVHMVSPYFHDHGDVKYLNLNKHPLHTAIGGDYTIVQVHKYGMPTCGHECQFDKGCPSCINGERTPHGSLPSSTGVTYPPSLDRTFSVKAGTASAFSTAGEVPLLRSAVFRLHNAERRVRRVVFPDNELDKSTPTVQLGLKFKREEAEDLSTRHPTLIPPTAEKDKDLLYRTVTGSKSLCLSGSNVSFGFVVDSNYTNELGGYDRGNRANYFRRFGFQFAQIDLSIADLGEGSPSSAGNYTRLVIVAILYHAQGAFHSFSSLSNLFTREIVHPMIMDLACNVERRIEDDFIIPSSYKLQSAKRLDSMLRKLNAPANKKLNFGIQEDQTADPAKWSAGHASRADLVVLDTTAAVLRPEEWQEPKGSQIGVVDMTDKTRNWRAGDFELWLSKKPYRNLVVELEQLLLCLPAKFDNIKQELRVIEEEDQDVAMPDNEWRSDDEESRIGPSRKEILKARLTVLEDMRKYVDNRLTGIKHEKHWRGIQNHWRRPPQQYVGYEPRLEELNEPNILAPSSLRSSPAQGSEHVLTPKDIVTTPREDGGEMKTPLGMRKVDGQYRNVQISPPRSAPAIPSTPSNRGIPGLEDPFTDSPVLASRYLGREGMFTYPRRKTKVNARAASALDDTESYGDQLLHTPSRYGGSGRRGTQPLELFSAAGRSYDQVQAARNVTRGAPLPKKIRLQGSMTTQAAAATGTTATDGNVLGNILGGMALEPRSPDDMNVDNMDIDNSKIGDDIEEFSGVN